MWNDVVELRDFYRTSLGQTAARIIGEQLRKIWTNCEGENILGLGYAPPYLLPFLDEAQRVLAFMPARQGVLHWPGKGPGLSTVCDEAEIPLPDVSIDRALLVHGLECSEQLRLMLREVWRVLADGGRLLIVVPNRRGIWARMDRTPFGQGNPYTPGQLNRLLRDTLFTPIRTSRALFVPPSQLRMIIAAAAAWEKIGVRSYQTFSGVLIVEAGKQIYAATKETAKLPSRKSYVTVMPPANRSTS